MFFKKKPPLNQVDIEDVRRRVHGIRDADEREGSLQLFARLGEELRSPADRPQSQDSLSHRQTYTFGRALAEPERPRVLPDQVPSTDQR